MPPSFSDPFPPNSKIDLFFQLIFSLFFTATAFSILYNLLTGSFNRVPTGNLVLTDLPYPSDVLSDPTTPVRFDSPTNCFPPILMPLPPEDDYPINIIFPPEDTIPVFMPDPPQTNQPIDNSIPSHDTSQ